MGGTQYENSHYQMVEPPYVTKTLREKLHGILRGILCGNSCTFHKCCVGYCVEYCVGLKDCVGIAVRFSNTAWDTARVSTPTPYIAMDVLLFRR